MSPYEVDVTTVLSDDRSALGVFLYHPDPDGRIDVEEALYKEGAEFVSYPEGEGPATIHGFVSVTGRDFEIIAGTVEMVGSLDIPPSELARVGRAVLYVLHEPFDSADRTEKSLLAASLPLNTRKAGTR